MDHIAIDLGGRESQICVRNAQGEITQESRVATKSLRRVLSAHPAARVVLETSAETFRVADVAREAGHSVTVVPSVLVRALGVGARGIKTDRNDARALSNASCCLELPSVHIPSLEARQLKAICTAREQLVSARTLLINGVRGYLRIQMVQVRGRGARTLPQRVRAALARQPSGVPSHVERSLVVIETLNEQLLQADRELGERVKADPVCQRLMSIPGVGPVTASRLRAAIDDVTRFRDAHHVESYLGVTPGERSSSERVQRTAITKAGQAPVRRALVQAAWCALRRRPNDPMVQWALGVAQRRGRHKAAVALARKMAGIAYALWRDGTTYRPELGAARTMADAA
jgi:transposase